MQPETYLNKHFGFDTFRDGQKEIVTSILSGRDTLVIMPTGGGKSLCYQLPAIMQNGLTIVISPLIALMKDQADNLKRNGISAAFINSSIPYFEQQHVLRQVHNENLKLLYIAPERLEVSSFINELKAFKISFIAIDEAHCISEWGHDFRPSYLKIIYALELLGRPPVIALTATATPEVADDIVNSLQMIKPQVFKFGFDRPNLGFFTYEESNKEQLIKELLNNYKNQSGIIYCSSRKRVEKYHLFLRDSGIRSEFYHAGLNSSLRKIAQNNFISGKSKVIVATSAFGMGIDKPDVRLVIHSDLPPTLESYYQESGRAGRDGNDAGCFLVYEYKDRTLQEFFINMANPRLSIIESVYNELNLNNIDLKNISLKLNIPEKTIESCINILEKHEIIKSEYHRGRLFLELDKDIERISEYYGNTNEQRRVILESLLRKVPQSAFGNRTSLDYKRLCMELEINENTFISELNAFRFADILNYNLEKQGNKIENNFHGVPFNELPFDYEELFIRRTNSFNKLDHVLNYAETESCKREYILNYFLSPEAKSYCGKCTSCLQQGTRNNPDYPKGKYLQNIVNEFLTTMEPGIKHNIALSYLKGDITYETKDLEKTGHFGIALEFSRKEIMRIISHPLSETIAAQLYRQFSKHLEHELKIISQTLSDTAVQFLKSNMPLKKEQLQSINTKESNMMISASVQIINRLDTRTANLILLIKKGKKLKTILSKNDSYFYLLELFAENNLLISLLMNLFDESTVQIVKAYLKECPGSGVSDLVKIGKGLSRDEAWLLLKILN